MGRATGALPLMAERGGEDSDDERKHRWNVTNAPWLGCPAMPAYMIVQIKITREDGWPE